MSNALTHGHWVTRPGGIQVWVDEFAECWNAGMSMKAMSRRFHITVQTVGKTARRKGLPRQPKRKDAA